MKPLYILLIILAEFGSGCIESPLASSSSEEVKHLDVPLIELGELSSNRLPICSYQEGTGWTQEWPARWTAKGHDEDSAKESLLKHLKVIGLKIDEKKVFCSAACLSEDDGICPEDYQPTTCLYKGVNYSGVNSCGAKNRVYTKFCQGADIVLDWRQDVKCEEE